MNHQEPAESSHQNSQLNILDLPDEQRQLINWITRQQTATVSEVVTYLNISEELVKQHLQTLVNQRFIQELNDGESVYYRPLFTSKQKSKLNSKIWDKF
ncbi:winged helix-turn-helix domain-containing protein [Nostoc sp. PCC 7107]|uniref:winged helix-turn-helix domain-containing protein n=1 Tax=Nostoc sp. PCC 7107 TaxID=317936 RepID=UPI00029F2954|nr:winged helix-turn-helix domain-containing protein [Nostoc sp. PCC 7107]AFY41889.1 transcriptional repressor, CopY family [Nostoc sp. PCC 7107]